MGFVPELLRPPQQLEHAGERVDGARERFQRHLHEGHTHARKTVLWRMRQWRCGESFHAVPLAKVGLRGGGGFVSELLRPQEHLEHAGERVDSAQTASSCCTCNT